MWVGPSRLLRSISWMTLVAGLTACGTGTVNRAPVEDRGASTSRPAPVLRSAAKPTPPAQAPLPGSENEGKPGYYTVKQGDTLIRIGLDAGQNWREIARWNNLDNPNQIEVGQVLRVVPPQSAPVTAAQGGVVTRPVASSSVQTQSVPPPGSTQVAKAAPQTASSGPSSQPSSPSSSTASTSNAANNAASNAAVGADQLSWSWPVTGPVLSGFDEVKNKGVDLGGSAGDPVLAAADGRVVYAGAGLRGYGNLIIVKHNNTYLTAYAHNQALLVKEDQAVQRGQKIAEMGSSDADRVKLHFEVRRQGKPVDPIEYLPRR